MCHNAFCRNARIYMYDKYMGRKKTRNIEDIKEQSRIRARRFYRKHAERLRRERMDRYWKEKDLDKKMPMRES